MRTEQNLTWDSFVMMDVLTLRRPLYFKGGEIRVVFKKRKRRGNQSRNGKTARHIRLPAGRSSYLAFGVPSHLQEQIKTQMSIKLCQMIATTIVYLSSTCPATLASLEARRGCPVIGDQTVLVEGLEGTKLLLCPHYHPQVSKSDSFILPLLSTVIASVW